MACKACKVMLCRYVSCDVAIFASLFVSPSLNPLKFKTEAYFALQRFNLAMPTQYHEQMRTFYLRFVEATHSFKALLDLL